MAYDDDVVMGEDFVPQEVPQPPTQGFGPDFVLTFGKHEGEKLSDVPKSYLRWLSNNVTRQSPIFTASLRVVLEASTGMEMELDWNPPPLHAAPDDFHQYRKLPAGLRKCTETALWITNIDALKYFSLSEEILRVVNVPTLPECNSSPTKRKVARYALYHVWDLSKMYIKAGEADAALRKFLNERPRGMGEGSPRKNGEYRAY
jgi:hypothetical protein